MGAFAGGILGARRPTPARTARSWRWLVYGFVRDGSVALPLGVHLAKHRRGNYGLSLLASLAIGAVGLGATVASGDGRIMIAVPVAQLASSIAIERATAQRGARRRTARPVI